MDKIFKKIGTSLLLILIFLSVQNQAQAAENKVTSPVVLVKTFVIDTIEGKFSVKQSGSGVIIDGQGTVLTNYHVISNYSGSIIEDQAIQVCVTADAGNKPNCNYVASVVAFDEGLDVALIKMKPIETRYGSSAPLSELPYLKIANSSNLKTGDVVTAIGYPEIGGETLTSSKGTIAGRESGFSTNWLKTDAVVSFGSSGGALVDVNQQLVGLVSKMNLSSGSSLGYALGSESFLSWINDHISSLPQDGGLLGRMTDLTKKQIIVDNFDFYHNQDQSFYITRQPNWKFIIKGEDEVEIVNSASDKSGQISIWQIKLPYRPARAAAGPLFKDYLMVKGLGFLGDFTTNKEITINGYQGKLLVFKSPTSTEDFMSVYAFPVDDKFVFATVVHGEDNQGQEAISAMINSIQIKTNNRVVKEVRQFNHNKPKISLKANNDWVFQITNDESDPLKMYNKKTLEAFGRIDISKDGGISSKLSSQQFIDQMKKGLEDGGWLMALFGYKIEIAKSATKVTLNGAIKNAIRVDLIYRSIITNKILIYQTNYYVPSGEGYINFSMLAYTQDKKVYEQALKSFNNMLLSLRLK